MLKKLTIQNYALIDYIQMDFDTGLHILTGETGAGKSIILGALGLVMGKRADLKSLFDPKRNCLVEASFDISKYKLDELLLKNDIDPDQELIIRRVISYNGKSRAFVNDLPVALKTLQELSTALVQLHHQFDNLDLGQAAYQLTMLDALAGNEAALSTYQTLYRERKKEKKELAQMLDEVQAFQKEKDFISFQIEEIRQIDLEAALNDDLENQLSILSNAEDIQQALKKAFFDLSEDDHAVISLLKEMAKNIANAGVGSSKMEELAGQLRNFAEELDQLGNELYEQSESIEHDPQKIAEIQDKVDIINKLMHKHSVHHISDLIELRDVLQQKLSREMEVSGIIEEKEKKIALLDSELMKKAENISANRKKIAVKFASQVKEQLKVLGMPHAQISGDFKRLNELGPTGIDEFELLFSANKGGVPASIKQVASGGELSRLSLSIKSILAGHIAMPTLIFDEIEAGISGEIALKMGKILKELSLNHQIINITHSAQIASRGDCHYFVYKSHNKDKTITRIRALSPEDRINEIAKMLSGDPPTPTALKNAAELIHLN